MPTDSFPATRRAALERVSAVRPGDYARSRNAIEGAVTGLSPYITHGLLSLPEVLAGVADKYKLDAQHKFVFELGWREYFRHVWAFRGEEIFESLREGLLPEKSYSALLPADIRQAATGVPVIDMAVRTLYATGYLHNHARMWLASYVVHMRKVHWRVAADWLYGHLLDGDLASNHLSWQWVAGTGSSKPYLFNADNVARYAPAHARTDNDAPATDYALIEPPLLAELPPGLGWTKPNAATAEGREVWLVHPWNLGELPSRLPSNTLVIGIFLTDFHSAWPWSEQRWRFVASRMSELTSLQWQGDVHAMAAALQGAHQVRSVAEPHLAPWLARLAACEAAPELFPPLVKRCDSFMQWWTRASRGFASASDLLAARNAPAW